MIFSRSPRSDIPEFNAIQKIFVLRLELRLLHIITPSSIDSDAHQVVTATFDMLQVAQEVKIIDVELLI